MLKARIGDIAYYLPPTVETNEFLVDNMGLDWTAEGIYKKTGIKQRHVSVDKCASDLGYEAAVKLFEKNKGLKEQIDYVLFVSQSPDYVLPSTACLLQERLELPEDCGAVDINQGCSGFIYGLSIAKGLIESGVAANILLITAETYTKYIDHMDKSTRTIFGDGAAATWIRACDCKYDIISGFVLGTNGKGKENLIVHNSGAREEEATDNNLFMDGPEIFQFTLMAVPKMVKDILRKENIELDDVDYFVFHQANAFILNHLRNKLKITTERFCIDMEDMGNTVSPSIPIALCRAMERGDIRKGMKALLAGFGVGYSWGGCVIEI